MFISKQTFKGIKSCSHVARLTFHMILIALLKYNCHDNICQLSYYLTLTVNCFVIKVHVMFCSSLPKSSQILFPNQGVRIINKSRKH